MRATFRIVRFKRRWRGFRIDKRILFKYCPLGYANSFSDCLQAFCNYCMNNAIYDRVTVFDAQGPNKVINIKYDKNIRLKDDKYSRINILCKCKRTWRVKIDSHKVLLLNTIITILNSKRK